jgi:hypothetical protein
MAPSKKEAIVTSPGGVDGSIIFEQLSSGNYLVYDKRLEKILLPTNPENSWEEWRSEQTGLVYFPMERLPWPAVDNVVFYDTEAKLYSEIKKFFEAHLDVPNPLLFDVYTCYVLVSWRLEDFVVAPYLYFLGPLASGKTRALECFQRVCYRGIMATSMSTAALFRALEAWRPTLLLDETEIYSKDAMVEAIAILNSGYRRGQCAIRIEKLENGQPKIGFFDVFGPKVLAGTEELAATLSSRCIMTSMSRNVKQVKLFIDEETAAELRGKLLMYRFRNLGKSLPEMDVNGVLQNARVIELFISLLSVAPTLQARENLFSFAKRMLQSRMDEEQASIEARVFEAVLNSESLVDGGKISTRSITDKFNEGLPEKEQVTSRFVGRKVTALGFEKCRLTGGPSGYYWDAKLIDRLKSRYYPSTSGTPSLTSLTSFNHLSTIKESEVCEESEVVPRVHLTVQEIIEKVKPQLTSAFMQDKLIEKLMGLGFSREESEDYVEHLKDKELIGLDDVGLWHWIRR